MARKPKPPIVNEKHGLVWDREAKIWVQPDHVEAQPVGDPIEVDEPPPRRQRQPRLAIDRDIGDHAQAIIGALSKKPPKLRTAMGQALVLAQKIALAIGDEELANVLEEIVGVRRFEKTS